VLVPQSARAPHQVIVGGDGRYYGRGAKGNRILSEGDVARLYQRRQGWEQDRDALLREAIEQQPYGPQTGRGLANLVAFVRPIAPDRRIWERASATAGDQEALRMMLGRAAAEHGGANRYDPNLIGANWRRRGADEWQLSSRLMQGEQDDPANARYLVRVLLNIDGRGHLFCGRAAEKYDERLLIFEGLIAWNVAAFLAMAGALYRAGGYHGPVDLGVAVTGLRGGYTGSGGVQYSIFEGQAGYEAEGYFRHDRVAAAELIEPEDTIRSLLRHLFDATTGREVFDPFA
jgi:hypothetical protein